MRKLPILVAIPALAVTAALAVSGARADSCTDLAGLAKTCPPPPPPDPPPPVGGTDPPPSSSPAPAPAPTSPTVAEVPGAADQLASLVNRDREAVGLAPLSGRADVVAIARQHSLDMATKQDIWHNDDYFSATSHRRLDAAILGENVADNTTTEKAHEALMASPKHRANLLDGRFTVVGLSVAQGADGNVYVTEDFLQPALHAAERHRSSHGPAPATAGPDPAAGMVVVASAPTSPPITLDLGFPHRAPAASAGSHPPARPLAPAGLAAGLLGLVVALVTRAKSPLLAQFRRRMTSQWGSGY